MKKSKIPVFPRIDDYNRAINIPQLQLEGFDIRRFERTMKTVKLKMILLEMGSIKWLY